MNNIDFTSVTEVTGYNVTKEQIQRMYQRYRFALEFCKDKEVLEIACGSGQGLGYIARQAKRVTGGDIDEKNLEFARKHYIQKNNIELKIFDAQNMPFDDNSFDVVILYEAIYYLSEPKRFIKEARRVLREGGILIVCTANKDWADFNPSPYSHKYFSVPEMSDLIAKEGFGKIQFYGGFKVENKTKKDKAVSFIKKTAVSWGLMPKTMKGKEVFKRVFCGKLYPLSGEIQDGVVDYIEPVRIDSNKSAKDYKVVFAIGRT
jgi:ubiquinone/menaquinone biosynthesis C-methylase UbiE